ncbi:MAG TPA: IS481 family transposase [Caulobacteraceae bacterium]|jgi:transposase InsO family protein
MPFKEVCRMEQRVGMLSDYDTGVFSVTALCARYGVSRDTFYLWEGRRASGSAAWFSDRSHAPHGCPHRTAAEQAQAIVALRRRFEHFGPKKIRAWLMREHPDVSWPAASTMGDILKRAGLVEPVRRRRRAIEQGRTASEVRAANEEWCTDFKGWFRTRDGTRCDPLTITDTHSRYLIETRIVDQTVDAVRPVFEAAFRANGLPLAIRSDNGGPFGSTGAGGLTRLSVWWLRLGVRPHFIRPASPQENGRHERMHRTLKRQTARPPADTAAEQQARFDQFRRHYNEERPHEALDQTPPARHWSASPRSMPERLEQPWYDADHQVRRVRTAGEIKWRGQLVFVGSALVDELVGVAPYDDGLHIVRFCGVDLGVIDHRRRFLRFAPLRHRLREAQEAAAQPKVSTVNPVQSVDDHSG